MLDFLMVLSRARLNRIFFNYSLNIFCGKGVNVTEGCHHGKCKKHHSALCLAHVWKHPRKFTPNLLLDQLLMGNAISSYFLHENYMCKSLLFSFN